MDAMGNILRGYSSKKNSMTLKINGWKDVERWNFDFDLVPF